jgi:hypothetical protein
MTYAVYTKNTASVAGPIWYARHQHAYLRIWYPTPWPVNNIAKVILRVHGGNPNYPFENAARVVSTTPAIVAGNIVEVNAVEVPNKFTDNGYVFVNIEYPQGGAPSPVAGTALPTQRWPLGVFPTPAFFVARAIQYIKRHYNDAALWGAGKSIDPEKIVGWFNSAGGVAGLLSQWMPTNSGVGSFFPGYPASLNTELPTDNAKCRVIYNDGGVISFPMIDPAVCPAATMAFFTHAYLYPVTPVTDPHGFGQVALEHKRRASPWFHLIREDVANRIPIYSRYTAQPANGLPMVKYAKQNPEAVVTGLYGPDDPFFGELIDDELARQDIPHKSLWGDATNNAHTGKYSIGGADLASDLFTFCETYVNSSASGF